MADFFKDEDEGYLEEPYDAPPKPLLWRIAGTSLKCLFWGIIILMNVMVFWRILSSGDPSEMETVTGNVPLAKAYEIAQESGALDGFALYQREHDDITNERPSYDDKGNVTDPGNYGYFSITNVIFFPSADQVQLLFRYNDSTLEHLAKDYALPEVPTKGGEYYDVTLRVLTDLTPEDKTDNDKEEALGVTRISATRAVPHEKNRYTYRRMIFEGLPELESIVAVYVDIYYIEDADYAADAYGTLCIWREDAKTREYKLSRDDIAAIKEFS
jgi:hypothetical protein